MKKQKTLSDVVYQDPKAIKKYCSKKHFDQIPEPLQDTLFNALSNHELQKQLKTKFVCSLKVGENASGEVYIEIKLGNDKTCKAEEKQIKDKIKFLDNLFGSMKKAMKRESK